MKAQGIFSRMDVLSSHYKEVEDHTSCPKLVEARPQDHASPPTIVVGCHDHFGQRCLKGRERSCRAKPHLRLRQKVFLGSHAPDARLLLLALNGDFLPPAASDAH